MNNFELIDDYLTNRLGDAEKAAFESELRTNVALQKEVVVQRMAIEGVKKARAAELKAMLNNVPMGANVNFGSASALKIAAGVVGAGLLIAVLSYYFNGTKNLNPAQLATSIEDSIKKSAQPGLNEQQEPATQNVEPAPLVDNGKEAKKRESHTTKESVKKVAPVKPAIEVVDPTEDFSGNASPESNVRGNKTSKVSVLNMAVEMDATNKKYPFHYQFAQGKLYLYGNFDEGLYEILEIHGDSRAVFMYYRDLYYILDEKQSVITKLEPIKDKALISKLKEYRGR